MSAPSRKIEIPAGDKEAYRRGIVALVTRAKKRVKLQEEK